MPAAARGKTNLILASLSSKDRALLEPDLQEVELPLRYQLAARNRRIEFVYFPDSGIASVVADGTMRPIEVGIIGREGITGLSILMGHDRSNHEIFVQVAGKGRRLRSAIL